MSKLTTRYYKSENLTFQYNVNIEDNKWRIEYREIQRSSRLLYNRKRVKRVVYPLGNRRFSLPRKAM